MEKVFAGPEQDKEKFELSKLSTGTTSPTKVTTKVIDGDAHASSQPPTTTTKFDEKDYDCECFFFCHLFSNPYI